MNLPVPPTTFRSVEPKLFERILDQTLGGPKLTEQPILVCRSQTISHRSTKSVRRWSTRRRNLGMREMFGQGVTDHDRKQYRGHFESQMVCFRALGVQGRACCSIALQVMTRLKFSSAIRLRNFRDLILIGGGYPSLISSGSRSLSGRNPNRRRPSQLTLITRIVAGTLIASLTQ